MSSHYPFSGMTALAAAAVAAFALLAPASVQPVRAQAAQAALSGTPRRSSRLKPPNRLEAPAAGGANTGNVAATDHGNPAQKSAATRAIDKAKEVAKSAGDIFARVPCQSPKGVSKARARCRRSRRNSSPASRC